MLAGGEPAGPGELHRQRPGRNAGVLDEEGQGQVHRHEPPLHLLQRAGDRAHGKDRLRSHDPRRHQDPRQAGSVPREALALRHRQVRGEAHQGMLHGSTRLPDPLIRPSHHPRRDARLPRGGVPFHLRLRGLRGIRVAEGGKNRRGGNARPTGKDARRTRGRGSRV